MLAPWLAQGSSAKTTTTSSHDAGPIACAARASGPTPRPYRKTPCPLHRLRGPPRLYAIWAETIPGVVPVPTRSPALARLRVLSTRLGDCPRPTPGTRRGANVESGGTEWGPAALNIEQTTADVGDPPLGRSRLRGRRLSRHGQPDSDTERSSAGRPAPRSVTRAGRAIRTAPNPGTSRGGALGASGGRRTARTASERDRSAGEVRGDPRGSPEPDGRRRVSPAT